MPSITCNCGFKVEGKDHYEAEAKAWHHAIKDHLDMLKEMTPEQIEKVLRNSDEQMGMQILYFLDNNFLTLTDGPFSIPL